MREKKKRARLSLPVLGMVISLIFLIQAGKVYGEVLTVGNYKVTYSGAGNMKIEYKGVKIIKCTYFGIDPGWHDKYYNNWWDKSGEVNFETGTDTRVARGRKITWRGTGSKLPGFSHKRQAEFTPEGITITDTYEFSQKPPADAWVRINIRLNSGETYGLKFDAVDRDGSLFSDVLPTENTGEWTMLAPNAKTVTLYMRPVTVQFNFVKVPEGRPEDYPRFSFNPYKEGLFTLEIGDGDADYGNDFAAGHQETVITEIKFLEPK